MKIIEVIQKSPEWLEWRKGGISASEISIILGESPYMTPWWLWAIKVGKIDRVDLSRNPIVLEGVRNEPRLRAHLEKELGTFLLPICAEYDKNPIFRASLDGFSDSGEPWELKWPTEKHWVEVSLLGRNSKAYQLYEPQVQQQMLVTGSSKGYLVFGNDGDNGIEARIFEIKRSDTRIDQIVQEGIKFWNMYQMRQAPAKDESIDFFEPEGDEKALWADLADRARAIEAELEPLKEKVAELNVRRDDVKSQAVQMMGKFRRGSYDGLNVTNTFRAGNIDFNKVIEDLGGMDEEKLEEYRKEGSFSARISVSAKSSNSVQDTIGGPPVLAALAESGKSDWF